MVCQIRTGEEINPAEKPWEPLLLQEGVWRPAKPGVKPGSGLRPCGQKLGTAKMATGAEPCCGQEQPRCRVRHRVGGEPGG